MKKLLWFGLAVVVFGAAEAPRAQKSSPEHTTTLYSPLQYHNERRAAVNLQLADYRPVNIGGDVGYGFGRFGDEFDWLQSSLGQDNRSEILDLGKHDWTDSVPVPWVEPLPKLKPGERREFVVDTSGQRGCDGRPGLDGMDGKDGLDAPGAAPSAEFPSTKIPSPRQPVKPCNQKAGPTVRTSPSTLRAILGHIYVIHVVDDRVGGQRDFYALFRVDALQRGDNCTISWKLIPPPQAAVPIK